MYVVTDGLFSISF